MDRKLHPRGLAPVFKAAKYRNLQWSDVAAARGDLPVSGTVSAFLDVAFMESYQARYCATELVDVPYGGWGEDRGALWSGSYLQADRAVHLGCDIDYPSGTPVAATQAGKVVRIEHRRDAKGDWGSTVLLRLSRPVRDISHLLYAHLSPLLNVSQGQLLRRGDVIGQVGRPCVNGGWYPHLHVQAISRDAFARHQGRTRLFDGYGFACDLKLYPDPAFLLR